MRKRTLCMILSAVMLLTLIPITVLAGTGADTITIENILPSGMLSGSIKFYNENGYAEAYVYNGILYFQEKNNHSSVINDLSITTPVAKDGNNYTATNTSGSFIFAMNSDALESITVSSSPTNVYLNGKYTKPHAHVVGGETVTFEAWTSDNSLPTTSGSYYLTKDVTLNNQWVIPNNLTINLCLNGHIINLNNVKGNNNISINLGTTLNLYDCGTAEHKFTVDSNGLWTLSDSTTNDYETIIGGCITGGKNGIGGAIYLSWTNDKNVTGAALNLYGGNIVGNQSTSTTQGGGAIFVDRPSTFNMYGGKIVGNTAKNGGAVYIYDNSGNYGTFNMSSGTISNNTASSNGGGVYVSGKSDFTMHGGEISNCAANKGAGVCNDGYFTMNGGTITENTANLGGGLDNSGTFNMTGGSISNNTANDLGGAINANGNLNIYGGEITNNKATNHSGGVCVNSNNVTIGGTAKITGNVVGDAASNAHLMDNKFITIGTGDKAPQEGMFIGITMNTPPGRFTSIGATPGDEQYFTSDNSTYGVFYKLDGFLELKLTRTVTFNANGHGTAPDDITVPDGSTFTEPTAPTETGYTFGGWYKEADCKNAWNFSTDKVTAATTLYAKWTANTTNVTLEKQSGTGGADSITATYDAAMPSAEMPTREGYTFNGYFDEASGGNQYYDADGASVSNWDKNEPAAMLFAQWTKNPTPKPDPKPTPEPEPINYKITQGANSIWVVAAGESPVFRSNADFSKFSHVLLDGKELAKKHYKYESGSTLITLTPEYTATLAVGKHTIEIVSTDGSAATVFYIEETIANTNGEGFALSTATMSSLFVACNIVGLSAVFFEIKKKRKNWIKEK